MGFLPYMVSILLCSTPTEWASLILSNLVRTKSFSLQVTPFQIYSSLMLCCLVQICLGTPALRLSAHRTPRVRVRVKLNFNFIIFKAYLLNQRVYPQVNQMSSNL